ncbi:MAG: flagellar basal body-associated FliL family protein [Spirochaetales bacterium]|nr:flagellar basal body-associated FliL family protein [Spirochaetales bacterium]
MSDIEKKSDRGVVILILGIAGLFVFVCGPIAWILGSMDLKKMKNGEMSETGRDMTKIGKIFGIIATVYHSFIALTAIIIISISLVSNFPKDKLSTITTSDALASTVNYEWFSESLKGIRTQITDDTGSCIVMLDVELGYKKGNKMLHSELNEKKVLLKDSIITILSSKTKAEMSNSNEQELKAEIKDRINELLKYGQIEQIQFDNKYILGM